MLRAGTGHRVKRGWRMGSPGEGRGLLRRTGGRTGVRCGKEDVQVPVEVLERRCRGKDKADI